MGGSAARIAKILLDSRVVSPAQLDAARAQLQPGGPPLLQVVVELGFAREEAVATALAEAFKLKRVNLAAFPADAAATGLLEARFCEERNLCPCVLRDEGQTLWVAISDPSDQETIAAACAMAGVARVRLVVAGHDEIQQALLGLYRGESFRPGRSTATGTIEAAAEAVRAGKEEPVEAEAEAYEVIDEPPPPPDTPAARGRGGMAGAQDDLEDLLGMSRSGELTAEEEGRLELLLESQARSSKALRALLELCMERGLFGLDEYRGKMR